MNWAEYGELAVKLGLAPALLIFVMVRLNGELKAVRAELSNLAGEIRELRGYLAGLRREF